MPPYHLALDCLDKHALSLNNKHKTALIAVRDGQARPLRLSFSQLAGLSNRMANGLKKLGLKKNERVLIRLGNVPEFPITILGATKLGALPVPSSPLYTWRELKFLLEDSGASALVTSPDMLPEEIKAQGPRSLKKIILVSEKGQGLPEYAVRWQTLLKESDSKFDTPMSAADDPAFWLYTSGTTGEPKAAVHAHRSIPAHDDRCRRWLGVREGDVIFNTSALNWSYALTAGMLDIWRHGLTALTYQGEASAQKIAPIVKHHGVSVFMSVPGIYRRLASYLKDHAECFAKVRTCLSAGENLLSETRKVFTEATGLEIFEGLGMTEHSVYLFQPSGEKPVTGSVGKATDPERIKILQEDLSEAGPGETGILATRKDCPGLMLGYYQKGAEPYLPLSRDWFLSGDLAHTDAGGNFFFQGRRDDVITAGGYRISPLEVERVINQHPLVEESLVAGRSEPGKTWIEAQVVLIGNADPSPELEEGLRIFARKSLAPFKVPRRLHFVARLPKTPTGKIKRLP